MEFLIKSTAWKTKIYGLCCLQHQTTRFNCENSRQHYFSVFTLIYIASDVCAISISKQVFNSPSKNLASLQKQSYVGKFLQITIKLFSFSLFLHYLAFDVLLLQ